MMSNLTICFEVEDKCKLRGKAKGVCGGPRGAVAVTTYHMTKGTNR